MIQDRFSSWQAYFDFANTQIASTKGQIYLIMESDITATITSGNGMIIPSEWPEFHLWGNKVMGEYAAGITSVMPVAADFAGNNQKRAKLTFDMENNSSLHCFVAQQNVLSRFCFVHFQYKQSILEHMFAFIRCTTKGYLECCKIERIGNPGLGMNHVLESINGGRLETRTPNTMAKINGNDPSDPMFLGGECPALEMENIIAGNAIKIWDANGTVKMVEYAYRASQWPNGIVRTSESRIHFLGANTFNHFLVIQHGSSFNTNGPICSISSAGGTPLTVTDEAVYAQNFCSLSTIAWDDGSGGAHTPVMVGTAKFYSSSVAGTDYAQIGDFNNSGPLQKADYPG